MRHFKSGVLLMILSLGAGASPNKSASPAGLPSEKAKPAISSVKNGSKGDKVPAIARMRHRLEASYDAAMRGNIAYPALYFEALTRLEEVEKLKKDKPKSKHLARMLKTCSLHVVAAETQLQVQIARNGIFKAKHKKDSIMGELTMTYQEINRLERGYASNLKKDLEEERRKALERQEEARKRFQTLQSDLINVKKDARGIILSMSDILFDIGKATLTQNLKTNLAKIAGILFVYKEANVIVEGHTDNTGSETFNQALSEKRAENVMQFLVIQGIPRERLRAVGYGLTKPVADNTTKEGRQKNRRVDLVISDPETLSRPQ